MFKWDGFLCIVMSQEETVSQLRIQEYLDEVSQLDMPHSESQWHQIDVASLLDGTKIEGHELDPTTGSSLIFLPRSAILCCPKSGRIHHYPKHLLHCFVDDNRSKSNEADGVLQRLKLRANKTWQKEPC